MTDNKQCEHPQTVCGVCVECGQKLQEHVDEARRRMAGVKSLGTK